MSRIAYLLRASAAFAVGVVWCSTSVAAGLTGSTTNISWYYPESTTLVLNAGDVLVSDTVEFPSASLASLGGSWEIDIAADHLVIRDTRNNGFPFFPARFNGFILRLSPGQTFLSATADSASQFVPVSLSIEGGNKLLANFQGISGPIGGRSILNIVVVPEPSALALALVGFAGIILWWGRLRMGQASRPTSFHSSDHRPDEELRRSFISTAG